MHTIENPANVENSKPQATNTMCLPAGSHAPERHHAEIEET